MPRPAASAAHVCHGVAGSGHRPAHDPEDSGPLVVAHHAVVHPCAAGPSASGGTGGQSGPEPVTAGPVRKSRQARSSAGMAKLFSSGRATAPHAPAAEDPGGPGRLPHGGPGRASARLYGLRSDDADLQLVWRPALPAVPRRAACGLVRSGQAESGAARSQPSVACAYGPVSIRFETIEEIPYQGRINLRESQPLRAQSSCIATIPQQEDERIAICLDRVGPHVPLSRQVTCQESG